METLSFTHSPGYGQFYLQDPIHFDKLATATFTREDLERGFHVGDGILSIFVVSQGNEIPIDVRLFSGPPTPDTERQWERVIETSLEVKSDSLVLAGCPDGPDYGAFGRIPVAPGRYGVRVHYGGQNTFDENGDSADFYLIQVWPSPRGSAL